MRLVDRLTKYIRVLPNGCWLWTGALTKPSKRKPNDGGYGKITIDNKTYLAHRVVYAFVCGRIPKRKTLDHRCPDKPLRACVRPDHLVPCTLRQNLMTGNSAAALNARKTHCRRGHAFTRANTGRQARGRFCRICRRADYKRYRERQVA